METFIPQRFGKFFLIDILGKGGMAKVYLATEIEKFDPFHPYEHLIALKQLFPKYSSQQGFIKCLVDEAKLTSMLKHPNIVEVLDLGNVGTDFYLTMQWLNGKSLHQLLHIVRSRNKVIAKSFLFYIFQKIARGLQYAHEMKDSAGRPLDMVHCDVSAQNILISYDGEIKLSDFGIATAEKSKEQASNEAILGKLPYMAPEQILMKGFDRRVDIYSFGVLMYEGLTGRKPLDAMSVKELQTKIVKEIPKYTSAIFSNSPQIRQFVEACLSKNPNDRPSSISEFFKLENESEKVDEKNISKLMRLLFQDDIKKEKENIQSAVQILISIQAQEDLFSEEDDDTFSQEPSGSSPTEIISSNANDEKTKVVDNESEKESVGKIQIERRKVERVIPKAAIEEEWIDAETTQRRMSKKVIENAMPESEAPTAEFGEIFSPKDDPNSASVFQPSEKTTAEKTMVDFDETLEKQWNERQKDLRTKNQNQDVFEEDKIIITDKQISLIENELVEFTEEAPQDSFKEAYPSSDEVVKFSPLPDDQSLQKKPALAEEEPSVAKIQLKIVRKTQSEIDNEAKLQTILKDNNKKQEEEFFKEISKSEETELRKNVGTPEKPFSLSDDAITFRIRKKTMAIGMIVIAGILLLKTVKPLSLFGNLAAKNTKTTQAIDVYVSIEKPETNDEKSSIVPQKNTEFKQSFLNPVQVFFEREYERYTGHQQLPFRMIFAGLVRDTPKIQWQGGIFSSSLPFETFINIFQIDPKKNLDDHASLFIHMYSKEMKVPADYPIDFQGDRPEHKGVLYYPLSTVTDSEFQMRLAHEILHTLGAEDLYNNKGLPKYPEGYVEPFKNPLHPQTYGEIMSRTIPQNPSEYTPLSSLEEARIGSSTAFRLGWITESEKNHFYQK